VAKLDQEIDQLFVQSPDAFTAERNALAKRLRADGERDGAERITKLKKPSQSAWLVNALALVKPGSIAELLEAAERLRKAASGGDATAMRSAAREESETLDRLVEEARDLAIGAGEEPAPASLERVRETLQAAQVDPELRETVSAGRLEREQRAASIGFDNLAAPPEPAQKRRNKAPKSAKHDASAKKASRKRLQEAKAQLSEAKAEAREAAREVARAEGDLARAERAREAADNRVARAQAKAESLD